jgi:acyl carrier protein/NAD(P)-dependent dehydrogenase (short-subunit alcohol dehydrogenase family)
MSRDCRGTLCLLLPSDAGSGPISGAAKVAATEYAPLRIQLAFADDHSDLTDRNPQDTWASRLNATAAAYESEPYVWQTRSRTFAPRLMPYTGTLLPQGSLAASGGNYLITGATGGLGTALIDWLIDDQFIPPERIVSVTRSAGATYRRVQSVCADLTDPGALRDALAPVPDIEGIFHLAGTLDDGMIDQMDAARMHRVLAPKLALESLLEHASRWRTQWAIAFSSTSSLLGVPGQANYAAANAWLDHLASWSPTSDQVPVLSIHWGTWGETGMSVRSGRALERAGKDGERSLRTQHALAALSCALAGLLGQSLPSRRLAVCDIDWRKSAWRDQPLVSGLLGHVAPATASSPGAVSSPPESGLHQAPEAQSDKLIGADAIRRFLEEYVSRWIEPLTLSEHGLDSLDLAQLRNGFFKHFGIQIPLSELSRTDLTLGRLAQRLRGFLKSDEPAVPA